MKTTKTTNRRKFLVAASLGTAGVAASVVAPGHNEPTGAGAAGSAKPTGYHLSEHILKYYKTTEV